MYSKAGSELKQIMKNILQEEGNNTSALKKNFIMDLMQNSGMKKLSSAKFNQDSMVSSAILNDHMASFQKKKNKLMKRGKTPKTPNGNINPIKGTFGEQLEFNIDPTSHVRMSTNLRLNNQ